MDAAAAAAVNTEAMAANDGYYLTPNKAQDKRRIANVRAKNQANARVFNVGGTYMTVRQIADELGASPGGVSKEIKQMRRRGLTRFTLSDFKVRHAANDGDLVGAPA